MLAFSALALPAVVAMLLQTTILPALPVAPDLVLVLAVYLGVRHPGVGGACGAFLLGYFLDTFSGTVLGMHAFACTGVYLAAHLIARHLWVDGPLLIAAVVFVGGCLHALALVSVATLVAARVPVWHHVVRYGVLAAAFAAIVAPAVFAGLGWEKRMIGMT